ncbi:hypothetical protein HispidOSU_008530 [Sigmodon hispidus]
MRSGSALTGPAGRPLLGPPCAARAGPSRRPRADGCSNIRLAPQRTLSKSPARGPA